MAKQSIGELLIQYHAPIQSVTEFCDLAAAIDARLPSQIQWGDLCLPWKYIQTGTQSFAIIDAEGFTVAVDVQREKNIKAILAAVNCHAILNDEDEI